MKIRIITFVLMVLLLNLQIVTAEENEYGIVKVWFNGNNATSETIEGIRLKIGEPIELKVEVILKIDGDVSFKLHEPGVTRAYKVINGPSDIEKRIDNLNIESGWSKTYTWTIVSNGAWKNGNAPLNIFVQFNKGMKNKKIDFTIANPFILDEQYPGSSPAQTTGAAQPSPTGASSEPQRAPFLTAAGAIAVIIGVWMVKKGRGRLGTMIVN